MRAVAYVEGGALGLGLILLKCLVFFYLACCTITWQHGRLMMGNEALLPGSYTRHCVHGCAYRLNTIHISVPYTTMYKASNKIIHSDLMRSAPKKT